MPMPAVPSELRDTLTATVSSLFVLVSSVHVVLLQAYPGVSNDATMKWQAPLQRNAVISSVLLVVFVS